MSHIRKTRENPQHVPYVPRALSHMSEFSHIAIYLLPVAPTRVFFVSLFLVSLSAALACTCLFLPRKMWQVVENAGTGESTAMEGATSLFQDMLYYVQVGPLCAARSPVDTPCPSQQRWASILVNYHHHRSFFCSCSGPHEQFALLSLAWQR